MASYDVYAYNLPKVDDGKLVQPGAHEAKTFTTVDDAKKFMADNRTKWERVVLIQTTDNVQKALERYRDGAIEPFVEK